MGAFKLGRMTMRSLFGKPACAMYPVKTREPYPRTKGHIEVDIETCILCGICEKKCPAGAITVSKPERTWTINPFSCVQCDSCWQVCPKKCLTMESTYTAPSAAMSARIVSKPEAAVAG